MDAMILAAGLGTRLRPLTDRTPKALIEVGGVSMLERVAARLVSAGADRLIVNVHHHAGAIERFLDGHDLGAEVLVSRESVEPLDTGGGLRHASRHFRGPDPFLLHNVDILSETELDALYANHVAAGSPIATLAAAARPTSRPLLTDVEGVYGVANHATGLRREARSPGAGRSELGFSGIHAISPRIFEAMTETGRFSIIDVYLRLIAAGETVAVFDTGRSAWYDIGDEEKLECARRWIAGQPPPDDA